MVRNYWKTFKWVKQRKSDSPVIYTSTCCKISAIKWHKRLKSYSTATYKTKKWANINFSSSCTYTIIFFPLFCARK